MALGPREQGIARLLIVQFREMRRFEEFPIPFDQLSTANGRCDRREPLVDGVGILAARASGMVLGRVGHSGRTWFRRRRVYCLPRPVSPGNVFDRDNGNECFGQISVRLATDFATASSMVGRCVSAVTCARRTATNPQTARLSIRCMTRSAHLAAWLFGLVLAVATVGTLAVLYTADVGAEILLAVASAVTLVATP